LTKKFERKAVKDFRKALVERQIRTSFYLWHKKCQRITIASQQKLISHKLQRGRCLGKFFVLWQKIYRNKIKKERLNKLKQAFLKRKFVYQSFKIWLGLFQSRSEELKNLLVADSHKARRMKGKLFH